MQFHILLSIIYLHYLRPMCLSWLFFLLLNKYTISHFVVNYLPSLSQTHVSVMIIFFTFKQIYCFTKKNHVLYFHVIKWKIIFGIKNLLNLVMCITFIVSLLGWLKFILFFLLDVFLTNFIIQHWINSRLSFLIFFLKIILVSFTGLPKLTKVDQMFFHLNIRS